VFVPSWRRQPQANRAERESGRIGLAGQERRIYIPPVCVRGKENAGEITRLDTNIESSLGFRPKP